MSNDFLTVELSLKDWQRLLEISDLGPSEQDIRILDALRYVITSGELP